MALRFFENSDDVTTATLAVCDSEATLHLLALLPDRHDEDVLVGTLQWSATADALEATGEHGKSSKYIVNHCSGVAKPFVRRGGGGSSRLSAGDGLFFTCCKGDPYNLF